MAKQKYISDDEIRPLVDAGHHTLDERVQNVRELINARIASRDRALANQVRRNKKLEKEITQLRQRLADVNGDVSGFGGIMHLIEGAKVSVDELYKRFSDIKPKPD